MFEIYFSNGDIYVTKHRTFLGNKGANIDDIMAKRINFRQQKSLSKFTLETKLGVVSQGNSGNTKIYYPILREQLHPNNRSRNNTNKCAGRLHLQQ